MEYLNVDVCAFFILILFFNHGFVVAERREHINVSRGIALS